MFLSFVMINFSCYSTPKIKLAQVMIYFSIDAICT